MILTLEEAKAHLAQTLDTDDDLIARLIAAAQNHVEDWLGYKIEERYPDTVPPALVHGVALLTAHWYENREASLVGINAQSLPFGLVDIINDYRDWSFGEVPASA
jgi:uncharacterized phage protein (predicted DNA packaging)